MRVLLIGLMWMVALNARAELTIEITGAGEHQTPLSVVRFGGEDGEAVSGVIANDLTRTGLFRLVDAAGRAPRELAEVRPNEWPGVEVLLFGSVKRLEGGNAVVKFHLYDLVRRTELMAHTLLARQEQMRALAHRIADMSYERLTGAPGVFGTRIAYVNREGRHYRLVIADSDGYSEQTVLSSNEPILSPAWSPDGRQLAYVSFERGRAMVYVQTLATRERRVLADFPGSNSAPAFAPDGKRLALVLTRDGNSELYLVNADGSGLQRLTDNAGIETEPVFAPDGQSLLFTSDRGGSAQIYRLMLASGEVQRLTYEGSNNFSPRFSPDGKSFVFSHFNGGRFYIATQDIESGQMQLLTAGGWEKKPSFAPNGKLVLFAAESQGRGILATVSSDGKVRQKMIAQSGDIREPVWGPFPQP